MKFEQLVLFSTFLLAASAKLKISKPRQGTEWEFGKKNVVKWKHDSSDKGKEDLHLYFTDGVDPEKFRGRPVASIVVDDVTKDSTEFDLTKIDVSQFPPSAEEYFLRFGDVNGSYSHLFTINGGKRATSNDSKPTSTDSKPTSNDSKPTSNDSNPTSNDSNPTSNDSNPTSNDSKPSTESPDNTTNNNSTNADANNANANANANPTNANPTNSTVPDNSITNGNNTVNGNVANNANGPASVNSPSATNGATVTQGNATPDGAEKTIITSFVAVVVAVAAFLF